MKNNKNNTMEEEKEPITNKQLGLIHILKKDIPDFANAEDDENWRFFLKEKFGAESSKNLSKQQGIKLIDELKVFKRELFEKKVDSISKPPIQPTQTEEISAKTILEAKLTPEDYVKSEFKDEEKIKKGEIKMETKKEDVKEIMIKEKREVGELLGMDMIKKASEYATELKNIIEKQKLSVEISGKKFVKCEGWQVLGAMLGCTPRITKVEKITDGYIAEAEVVNINGIVLSRAQAMCLITEKLKKKDGTIIERWEDEYAIMSMAQTRAVSKAFRLGFSWIVGLAGFEPTPAEEVKEGGYV